MTINYKHKFYIYHPDGKFTEAQIKELLDAAYKAGREEGYNDGYNAGKNSNWTITYPSPYWDTGKITCTPTVTTTATSSTGIDYDKLINNTMTVSTKPLKDTLEFRYNGTEK